MSRAELERRRVAALMERLITDPAFRAAFRRRPADEMRAFGLGHLAEALEERQKALQTLEVRESKSSLAGLLLAAAAEGAAAVEVVGHVDGALASGPGAASEQAAGPSGGQPHPAEPPPTPAPAPAEQLAPGAARMRNTARGLPAVRPRDADMAGLADGAAALADGPGVAYPGDDASQEQLASWMAAGARRAGIPPELPVMAALTESGLRNLRYGDRDSLGFFQMRTSIWNRGEYAGYVDRPELQMSWFIRQAHAVREANPDLYRGAENYGTWVADIERPAEQYRGRYQLQLERARELIRAAGSVAGAESSAAPAAAEPVVAREGMMRNTAVAMPAAPDGAGPDVAGPRGAGEKMVSIARRELGVAESPPGSNESPRIAHYREATAGAPGPGPWCAYFVSWVANEAGVPLGEARQGFGSVDDVWAWAESAGRGIPAQGGPGPSPGDLIVWDEHIGLVEKLLPGGRVQTIEGNSGDHVARRVHSMSESIIGYVRMR
jgi:cell wall-associated NlpC family hydrolase